MQTIIRKSEKKDCTAILNLVKELAIYENAPEAVTVTMEHFIESGFGEKPVWEAFVAEQNNEVFGFALYYIRYSTWKGQRMYLEDFYVTEKMRGSGAGKLLFDKIIETCTAKKYSGLVWQVLDWNEPAINFYRKYNNVKFDNGWINCSIDFEQ